MVKPLIVASVLLSVLSGCATRSHYTHEESPLFYTTALESTVRVDTSLDIAQKNIFEKARSCWRSLYTGKIETKTYDTKPRYGRVAFVMPGRLVGSKVTLFSVDFYQESGNRSLLVSRSHTAAGNWNDFDLAQWAEGNTPVC